MSASLGYLKYFFLKPSPLSPFPSFWTANRKKETLREFVLLFFFFLVILPLKKPLKSTMAPKFQPHPPFAVVIDEPLFLNDCTYIPKPSMEDGRRKIWYCAYLISYSVAGIAHAFMGPLPGRIKKTQILKDFFPTSLVMNHWSSWIPLLILSHVHFWNGLSIPLRPICFT